MLCNHHFYLVFKHFHLPLQRKPHTPKSSRPLLPSPQPSATTSHLPLCVYLFQSRDKQNLCPVPHTHFSDHTFCNFLGRRRSRDLPCCLCLTPCPPCLWSSLYLLLLFLLFVVSKGLWRFLNAINKPFTSEQGRRETVINTVWSGNAGFFTQAGKPVRNPASEWGWSAKGTLPVLFTCFLGT